jgi:hypothetical protein
MQTLSHPNVIIAQRAETKSTGINLTAFWDALEESRFGFTPLFLVLAVCFGGIAAAAALQKSLVMLSVIALSTGLIEVLLISISSMKTTFWLLIVALLIDLSVVFI